VFVAFVEQQRQQQQACNGATLSMKQVLSRYLELPRAPENFPFSGVFCADAHRLKRCLATRKTRDGSSISSASLNTSRSAVRYLFHEYSVLPCDSWDADLRQFRRGARRQQAFHLMQTGGDLEEGVFPFPLEFYKILMRRIMSLVGTTSGPHRNGCHFIDAHLFFSLTWNLICRGQSTATIGLQHLDWEDDALTIKFAHQKNDQEGQRRDPRHVFANPGEPAICPILSLGLFFACGGLEALDSRRALLFESADPKNRYGKLLQQLLWEDCVVREEATKNGWTKGDIGLHSFRKGASTYCCNGGPACPPIAATILRAGWKFDGVQGRYIRFESAGDCYLGRFVAGLPQGHPLFASSPPYFMPGSADEEQLVDSCVRDTFPSAPHRLFKVLRFCLASIVYHQAWIRTHSPQHPVLVKSLFTGGFAQRLQRLVRCSGRPCADEGAPPFALTGIPPDARHAARLDGIEAFMQIIKDGLSKVSQQVQAGNCRCTP
jgi:hypothetical protein